MDTPKAKTKISKSKESKRGSSNEDQPSRRRRKALNPSRIRDTTYLDSQTCKNSLCQAVISANDKFCKRCSCCICHSFDNEKDPSLWLECKSDNDSGVTFRLSCHVECALKNGKVASFDAAQSIQLDGNYYSSPCVLVSEILGCWKKNLIIAREVRLLDALCCRISLCYRLFENASMFKELHEIVKKAKEKLDIEVGPLIDSRKTEGVPVSELSVAAEVKSLCSLAILNANRLLSSTSRRSPQLQITDDGGSSIANKKCKIAGNGEEEQGFPKESCVDWNLTRPQTHGLAIIQREIHTKANQGPIVDTSPEPTQTTGDLVVGSAFQVGNVSYEGENFRKCFQIIRWLERKGHVDKEFRMKFLTWFGFRSTQKDREVIWGFIDTLIEDPQILAEQLVDSFSAIA